MQVNVKTNIKEISKNLTRDQKKQVPFASAMAINNTLFQLRKEMGKQTRKKLDRPTKFTQTGFIVQKAKKQNLKGMLFLRDAVEKYLKFQIVGGIRSTGKYIPVPFKQNARLNKFGNIVGKRSGLIKKKSQFIGTVNGLLGVWERQKGNKLKLIIAFERTVEYKPKLPFYTIAQKFSAAVFDRNFTKAITRAIKSAR
tara:strand:+ start:267 stop:857 length:591 start_codon:yes stop_codon:yes gene_type:complete